MFPCPWCSHMGPHYLPTLSTICGGCPPTMGAPQHLCPATRGCPLKGGAPKQPKNSSHEPWDLVPSRWDKMFSATISSEKFRKVPEHFRHPLKLFWTCSKTFSAWWFKLETFSFFFETISAVSQELFPSSLKLFR